ncbi:protein kinase domain-containing protein [Elongatibacter sediminis]|uniref:Protein kinase domain-containing protein n=1 Tax=Elongatibacter sediminis TaxID=3119006 RepID=A0AAW9R5Z9_9GAMM
MKALQGMDLPGVDELRSWIGHSLCHGEHVLARSNQGTILLYQQGPRPLIVKTAMGRGVVLRARRQTLLREYAAYRRLEGVVGVPACYGMIDRRYLLLEYVAGTSYREATLDDREAWFEKLLEILHAIHARGVAHGDLKSKGNLLVTASGEPCVVDFGTAFVHRTGFHPVNNWFFRTARRMDRNAWVKHKYRGFYRDASEEDSALLDYSWIERVVRRLSGRPMDRLR